MKTHFKLSVVAVSLILSISACNFGNEGIQGEWSDFSYTVGSEDEERTTQSRVLVENSSYRTYRGRIQFEVDWKAINTGKEPQSYTWGNKALMDSEGRIFQPYEGEYAEAIQPLDESYTLSIRYNLPGVVNVDELYWGLYHGDPNEGLKYKVKLTPENREN